MKKTSEKMEQGRRWLALVRGAGDEGDDGSKERYLLGKGFEPGEIEELLKEERAIRVAQGRV
jgi:hypothetical protein